MPNLSVSQAVEAFDVERRTLQRLLALGKITGAQKDAAGRWAIPVESLHAAQINARQTWRSDATNSTTTTASVATDATNDPKNPENSEKNRAPRVATDAPGDATLRDKVFQLETQLDLERRLREAAERNAEDLRTSLRMLEAGSSSSSGRRRWWRKN